VTEDGVPGLWRRPTTLAALVVALGFLFNFLARGVADAYTVFLVAIEAEYGWPRSALTSVYALYMLTQGLAAPVSGMLFERLGPRAVYAIGLGLLGTATFGAGALVEARWQLHLLLGVVAGLGVSAMGMVPAAALIGRWYRRNMSTALGIAYAGFGSGILVIAPLAQFLIERLGWRGGYQAIGLALLTLVPVTLLLPWRTLAAGHPDMAELRRAGAGGGMRLPQAVRTGPFWALVQVFFFTALGMYVVIAQAVALLVDAGYAPMDAAAAFGVAGMLSVLGVVASGWLGDRLGFRATATLSFASTFAGVLCLIGLSQGANPVLLAGYTLLFGIAQGARGPIVSTLTNRIFAGAGVGTIYGSIFATMSLGAALGSWLAGMLHDLTGGYAVSLLFAAGCIVLAALPFWVSPALARPQPLPLNHPG